MSLKSILAYPFAYFVKLSNDRWIKNPLKFQKKTFHKLIEKAKKTTFGLVVRGGGQSEAPKVGHPDDGHAEGRVATGMLNVEMRSANRLCVECGALRERPPAAPGIDNHLAEL